MSTAKDRMRDAQIKKKVGEILAQPINLTKMGWEAGAELPEVPALSDKLVDVLKNSPSISLEMDEFVTVTLLGRALKSNADKIIYSPVNGGYKALFLRRSPKWLRWVTQYYPCDGTEAYVSTMRMTVNLPQLSQDEDEE